MQPLVCVLQTAVEVRFGIFLEVQAHTYTTNGRISSTPRHFSVSDILTRLDLSYREHGLMDLELGKSGPRRFRPHSLSTVP